MSSNGNLSDQLLNLIQENDPSCMSDGPRFEGDAAITSFLLKNRIKL